MMPEVSVRIKTLFIVRLPMVPPEGETVPGGKSEDSEETTPDLHPQASEKISASELFIAEKIANWFDNNAFPLRYVVRS
jgi:hypothetical protein